MLASHLEQVGVAVDPVGPAEDAITAIGITQYDGIVLEVGLPGASGMTVPDHVRRTALR